MKLYNICMAEESTGDLFVPRVPNERAHHEDDSIPRICLSSSLSGCVSAVPWGGLQFDEMILDLGLETESYPFKVYEFDTDDIIEENLIPPSVLYEKDWVRDAVINDEYWVVNQTLKPRKSYFISITEYIEEVEDCISYENQKEMDRLDSLGEPYEYNDYTDGCYSKILADDYKIIDDSLITVGDVFTIPLSKFSCDISSDRFKEILEEAFNNFLVLDNYVSSSYIHKESLVVETDMPCTLVLDNVIKYINEECLFD